MRLIELLESATKTAVVAFGRLNPPTVGHKKLVDKITSIPGDHFLFLSHTNKPKDNPLPFDVKLQFAEKFFPNITVGNEKVRTVIDMMQYLEQLGYNNIVYVAGSDRVDSFTKLLNDYNGKEYNFDRIEIVSAGDRDPDSDDVTGMSASKMRAAAADDDFDSFSKGVIDPDAAQDLYTQVQQGMVKKQKNVKAKEEAAGVGTITKQNTTKDVNKGTLRKMMKGYRLV
jgi:nicotinic acid mononucleotide adenylyltransferase